MKNIIDNYARWIAWSLLGIYIFLTGIGLAIMLISGMPSRVRITPDLVNVIFISWSIVGVLLISRQPRNPIGWIFVTMPVMFSLDTFARGYAYSGSIANPGSLPYVEIAIIWTYWTGSAVAATWVTLLALLFPTGRPMSRRWGKLAWAGIISSFIYVFSTLISPLPTNRLFPTDVIGISPSIQELVLPLTIVSFFGMVLCMVVAVFSFYLRLRKAMGVERQQIKWFAFASAFFIPGVVLIILGAFNSLPSPDWASTFGLLLTGVGIAGIPIASAIAIQRYRLWDIDIIIRRTLIYGILTGLLALIYFLSVTLLQSIATSIIGQTSPLVIVLSTLAIAALFTPLRRGIQNFIDRRFYRTAYNADRILQEFAVTARDEVDVDALAREILKVIDSTMKPRTSSLWLKTG
jgi:hypothetical protein